MANSTEVGEFDFGNWGTWQAWQFVVYWAVIMGAQELFSALVSLIAHYSTKRIPVGGKHLDKLGFTDWAFVYFNRFSVPVLIYYLSHLCIHSKHVEWNPHKLTVWNTVGSLLMFFFIYDMVYVQFHKFLHIRGIYKWVHKHHHKQMAPSRGNVDASNTHPLEFVPGECIHLLCVYLVPCHVYTVVAFMALGGVMASLNHTRFDLGIPYFYDVKAHDTHHRLPQTNYGQYTMYWDKVFGSFKPYEKDLVDKSFFDQKQKSL
mmetsp:Transcript_10722/g.17553  ORF Transcript_10722/g.17553 Transcript_10722/m.17553 type:complete len:260 (+) Transcript_10722:172-951(+)